MAGDVFLVAALRPPIGVGKPGGALRTLPPLDLMAQVRAAAAQRAGVAPEASEGVIFLGCVSPIGKQGANIARLAALKAGFPVDVPGVTLNRMCGSSQQAIHFGAQATAAGDMTTLVHELERRQARYGLPPMCIGHGMATATIIERL